MKKILYLALLSVPALAQVGPIPTDTACICKWYGDCAVTPRDLQYGIVSTIPEPICIPGSEGCK